MGHWGPKCHGGKPLQPRNAPPPRLQQRKSRCPRRNHNHHCGWDNKTDTIDIGKDHSPQDEIALHYIQPNMMVRNTHPKEIMVGDVHAHDATRHTPPYSCLQVPAEKGQPHSASRLIPELEAMCYPSVCFDAFTQIRSAQLACPLALITSVPDSPTYNGSQTPLYGALFGPITWQPDYPVTHPHKVNSYWYVADTPGPTILGLPSSEKLAVVKMNCAIMVRQPSTHPAPVSTTVATTKPATTPEAAKSIRSTDDLIKEFPDRFKGIGRFPSKYKIQLCHDAHPMIHAPRKCPLPYVQRSRSTSTRWDA